MVADEWEGLLSLMKSNWEQPDWPRFRWDSARFRQAEDRFLFQSGVFAGTVKHLGPEEREQLIDAVVGDGPVWLSCPAHRQNTLSGML